MGTNCSVSSARFKPNQPRFFLPVSRMRPLSSGMTAADSRKNFWNWFLPSFSASAPAAPPSGAILTRKPLMMLVLVVSPPVWDGAAGWRGGTVCRGAAGWDTGVCAAGWGAVRRGAGCVGAAGRGAGVSSSSAKTRLSDATEASLSGAEDIPTLRRISSIWWSVTVSDTPAAVCWTLSSCRMRSTESLVRLLGIVLTPFKNGRCDVICGCGSAAHHSTGCRLPR